MPQAPISRVDELKKIAGERSFVEPHGGTVAVTSPGADQGSTFSIRLPHAVDIRSEKLFAALETEELKKPETKGFRLPLVDNNTDAAETLGALMEIKGIPFNLPVLGTGN